MSFLHNSLEQAETTRARREGFRAGVVTALLAVTLFVLLAVWVIKTYFYGHK